MPRNLLRLLAVLATAMLILGACGDDDGGSGDDTTTTTAAPSDIADGDDADGDDADDTDDTTDDTADEGDDGDAPSTETTVPSGSGSEGAAGLPDAAALAAVDDFCDLFVMFDDVEDPFEIADDAELTPEESAAQTRESFQFVEALFIRATQLAPNEIKADMGVFADFIGEWNGLLAEHDYDFMAMMMASATDPEIEQRFTALETEELDAASNRIEEYVSAQCGIDLD